MDRQSTSSSLSGVGMNWLKHVWAALVALAVLLGASSCDTSNVGNGINPVRLTLDVGVPSPMFGGWSSTWVANWSGGKAPFTLTWDLGGGAHENTVVIENAVSPATADFCMGGDSFGTIYTYFATLTDAAGLVANISGRYILSPTGNMQPRIEAMAYENWVLSVYVSDGDDSYITVTIDPGPHFIGDGGKPGFSSKVVGPPDGEIPGPCERGIEGLATFDLTIMPDEILFGASSEIEIMASDTSGGVTSDSILITIDPFLLEDDTLYAFAFDPSISIGDSVTIQIVTGETAHPFQFMLGVGVVLDDDASYVGNSFNVGAIGGPRDAADGVWADITIDGGFALGPDILFIPGSNHDDSLGTSNRYDFNISPLQLGVELEDMDVPSVTGALFNFQVTYSSAGEKQIGFQEFNGVNRTYYSDATNRIDRFWSAYEGATIIVN